MDDPDGMFSAFRNVPIHTRRLIDHVVFETNRDGHRIVVSDHALATMGAIIDMIIIDATYSCFIPDKRLTTGDVKFY